MSERKISGIPIHDVPKCVYGTSQNISLHDWLEALNHRADAHFKVWDDTFTKEDFQYVKYHLPQGTALKRFQNFSQFKEYLGKYINSQLCTPACLEEMPPVLVYEEGAQGLQAARLCPDAPPLPALPKKSPLKPPPTAGNEKPKEEPPRRYYEEGLPWKKPEQKPLEDYTRELLAGMMELSREGYFGGYQKELDKVRETIRLDRQYEGHDLLFVVDTSGSMAGFHSSLLMAFETLFRDAKSSVKNEDPAHLRMGILQFVDGNFSFIQPLAFMEEEGAADRFKSKYEKLIRNNEGGYEPVADAIHLAITETGWEVGTKDWAKSIIVLTDGDGLNEEENWTPTGRHIGRMMDRARQGGFKITVVKVN